MSEWVDATKKQLYKTWTDNKKTFLTCLAFNYLTKAKKNNFTTLTQKYRKT